MAQKGRRNADHQLLLALACGATIENAARQAGISERTAYNRLQEADFQSKLQAIRNDMVSRAAANLTAATGESVRTLLRLQSTGVPFAVQLGAAKAVIELGVKLRENADLAERIAALELQIAAGAA